MKRFALALGLGLGLGLTALATPASAARLSWDVEYSGWWEENGGGSIFGTIIANEADAVDGIISADELQSWSWNWSGNDAVSAFSISSRDENAEIQVVDSVLANGFYIDGTTNQPFLLDGLDQLVFAAGDYVLDLEFLFVEDVATGGFSEGNPEAIAGAITTSEPTPVPEPTSVLGLLALAGAGAVLRQRQKQQA